MHANGRANGSGWPWTADLRDYARWEYGRDAEAFLLAIAARTSRRPRRVRPIRRVLDRLASLRLPSVDSRFVED